MTVLPYFPLGDEVLRNIIRLQLKRIGDRVRQNHRAEFTYDEALVETVAGRCKEVESGGRNVDHILSGTLLPEMSRRIAAGDEAGSRHAQNRAVELTLLLTLPCVAAFLLVPDLIMRALFLRGAFSAANAHASAMTLVAYAFGLIPFVLMRSATITFLSRGDTVTPVKALAVAVTVNVAFKILFVYATSLEQVGLALATSIGAWVNLILLLWLASRAGLITVDAALRRTGLRLVAATLMLGLVLWLAASPVADVFAGQKLHEEATLAALAVLGALVYGGVALTLLGKGWLAALRRRQGSIS